MSGRHRWAIGVATSTGILGLTMTSGLAMLANHFVKELSRPHAVLNEAEFSWITPAPLPEPPYTLQRPLLFQTTDGALISGEFWAQPEPAPTIVLCHGYRISRLHLRSVASLEYARGYNVLCFDFRGHGTSDSVITSGGNAEVRDLEAAIMAASRQPETIPGRIILHGFSMGAAVALLTPPGPEVAAIIADSPYARSDDIIRRIVQFQLMEHSNHWPTLARRLNALFSPLAWATVAMSAVVFRLRFGYGFVARPRFKRWKALLEGATQPRTTPILLIHARGDQLIPIQHAYRLATEAKANDIPLETYFVDAIGHCSAYGYNPTQYDMVLRTFLERHLQSDFPAKHRNMKIPE
ncbi:alpha/beta hydrolase family protein [Thermosporothrix hazakensis]|jgi:alpha-beta hydrolase superfamily lysophospholipase|uniref:Alpha/beta hydrolase family protein n=2 Tax=Thermosporothrix TaxID=768650 RepID=A0A326UBX7_THEHA|nr:alpha/beta fold hydrolase [Thermosporothrix hazakensis]PZW36007.1 alpha/beta hydrolase family protein [Thermosporothrix hazakensis]BBH88473.1 hypothetical protein KTC_32240 [Thermosporothrix sp. COM3]GCE46659.1 hypothetical protein KTH_15280 [Thermosporothrix hazakensis]